MKKLEYYVNTIYYFHIKFFIMVLSPLIWILKPFLYMYYNFPYVKQWYLKRNVKDPYGRHIKVGLKRISNRESGLSSYYAFGLVSIYIAFVFFGIFHIIEGLFIPDFEEYFEPKFGDPTLYLLVIFGIAAFVILTYFVEEKSSKYFKEFDEKKGWWRIKWKTITFLAPILTLTFALATTYTETFLDYLKTLF